MKLLLAYPAAWRERYGDELASLIEADSEGGRVPWGVKLDVIRAGLAERLRSSGPPEVRIRAGVLLVLKSWAAFVVAGIAFAKTAEHWRAVTPESDRRVPTAAFAGVLLGAELGTLAVLLGIVLVARPLFTFLRAGGWQKIHRPVLRAIGASGLTVAVFLPVVVWAHHLTSAQRNGGDWLYGSAFVVLAVCSVVSIALWTHAAVVTACQLTLTRAALGRETLLAVATTIGMAAMTIAATVWWTHVYSALPLRPLVLTLAMAAATVLATFGTFRSARALRA
jgi:hypothetical protein